jgi:hypothetical protein
VTTTDIPELTPCFFFFVFLGFGVVGRADVGPGFLLASAIPVRYVQYGAFFVDFFPGGDAEARGEDFGDPDDVTVEIGEAGRSASLVAPAVEGGFSLGVGARIAVTISELCPKYRGRKPTLEQLLRSFPLPLFPVQAIESHRCTRIDNTAMFPLLNSNAEHRLHQFPEGWTRRPCENLNSGIRDSLITRDKVTFERLEPLSISYMSPRMSQKQGGKVVAQGVSDQVPILEECRHERLDLDKRLGCTG